MSEISPVRKPRRFARELTSVVGVPVVILTVKWAPASVYILVVFVLMTIALHELLLMGKAKGYAMHHVLSTALLYLLLSAFFLPAVSLKMAVFAIVLLIPAAYVVGRSELADALPASAVSIMSILYIGMLGGAIIGLRFDFPPFGASLVFFLFIVVWAGDAGAYYVGRRFGKHQLSSQISPKKTTEGLLGGIVASVGAAAIVHFTFFPEFPLAYALIAAAILSAAGVIGDLAESMWKRSAAVKDSGHIFPGHGGVFDRFDSILFTAPILYAYWSLLTRCFKIGLT